jgi:DNA oxidative demethylase
MDLFDPSNAPVVPGLWWLQRLAAPHAQAIMAAVAAVAAQASWRQMVTPGGRRMSVQMSNCGPLGWVSDSRGYRYDTEDPATGRPWPAIPDAIASLATDAARRCGFASFEPDACLINRYEPGARMSLHQDRNERDFTQPIVSVSLGLPAVFLFGGLARSDRTQQLLLQHGDVLVWGGPARLRFHGVRPIVDGEHPATGRCRINLTLRKAG